MLTLYCKICNLQTTEFAQAAILQKYKISYFHCPNCGFVQTEDPYWLNEAYTQAIADEDTGLVKRNLIFSDLTAAFIDTALDRYGRFLDYGGGYGLFVRLMLDKGYNFYRYDLHCQNLFAKGYDALLQADEHYELITAIEVFEHFLSPMNEINKLLKHSDTLLFCTHLIEKIPPHPTEWWYYALPSGQHIALYSLASLEYIAKTLGLNLFTDKNRLHILTRKNHLNIDATFREPLI